MSDYVTFENLEPVRWPSTAASIDLLSYPEAEIQVIGWSAPITLQRSFNNVNFVNWPVWDSSGTLLTTIVADGIYMTDGSAFLKMSGGGSATLYYRGGY